MMSISTNLELWDWERGNFTKGIASVLHLGFQLLEYQRLFLSFWWQCDKYKRSFRLARHVVRCPDQQIFGRLETAACRRQAGQ
jgi:hypothetical protein